MKDENTKNNLYRLKSIIIENNYKKHIRKQDNDVNISLMLKNYIKNLKEINLIFTRADNESLIYGSTSYPDTLTFDEISNRNCFFATILGFIDANLNVENSRFFNNLLIEFRNQVVYDYKNNFSICEPKILLNIIEQIPCPLNDLVTITDNKYESIKFNFLASYSYAYSCYNKDSIINIYDLYMCLITDLNEHQKRNYETTKKLRLKKGIY